LARALQIALLDDHQMFLDGISMLFNGFGDRFNVTPFNTPKDLIDVVDAGVAYDLVICDLIMREMNGLAFITTLRSHSKSTPILMLSGINTDPPINEIIRLGANGFIHKSADNDTLLAAVDAIAQGKTYFPEGFTPSTGSGQRSYSQSDEYDEFDADHIPNLSKRQVEVLELIANGASNKQISAEMTISENTVKSHLKQIFAEMRVNKRTACVRKARTLGLI
jgi:DNA-binding NarL/FixJ family response regulator